MAWVLDTDVEQEQASLRVLCHANSTGGRYCVGMKAETMPH